MSANPPPASPAASFKGYSLIEYLKRNKAGIKVLLGVAAGYVSTKFGANTDIALALGTVIKFALDAVDYFLSEQPPA